MQERAGHMGTRRVCRCIIRCCTACANVPNWRLNCMCFHAQRTQMPYVWAAGTTPGVRRTRSQTKTSAQSICNSPGLAAGTEPPSHKQTSTPRSRGKSLRTAQGHCASAAQDVKQPEDHERGKDFMPHEDSQPASKRRAARRLSFDDDDDDDGAAAGDTLARQRQPDDLAAKVSAEQALGAAAVGVTAEPPKSGSPAADPSGLVRRDVPGRHAARVSDSDDDQPAASPVQNTGSQAKQSGADRRTGHLQPSAPPSGRKVLRRQQVEADTATPRKLRARSSQRMHASAAERLATHQQGYRCLQLLYLSTKACKLSPSGHCAVISTQLTVRTDCWPHAFG